MKRPSILKVHKDLSNPWFEQIEKTIRLHVSAEPEIYYSIKPRDYVTVLAQTIKEKVIILKQFRPAIEGYTYEFTSGHVEDGETPVQAALRELKEETNCEAENIVPLGELMPDTGRLENRLWAFYASGLVMEKFPDPEQNEGIEVILVSPGELHEMIDKGTFSHALDLGVLALAIAKKHFKFYCEDKDR